MLLQVKCDRRKPACSQCAKTSVVCSYDAHSPSSSFSAHHHHHQHPQPTTQPSLSEASLLSLDDSLSAEWPLQWDLDSSPFVSAAHDFSALLYQDDDMLPSSASGVQTANLQSPSSAKVCQVNRTKSTSRQRRGPHWALVSEKVLFFLNHFSMSGVHVHLHNKDGMYKCFHLFMIAELIRFL